MLRPVLAFSFLAFALSAAALPTSQLGQPFRPPEGVAIVEETAPYFAGPTAIGMAKGGGWTLRFDAASAGTPFVVRYGLGHLVAGKVRMERPQVVKWGSPEIVESGFWLPLPPLPADMTAAAAFQAEPPLPMFEIVSADKPERVLFAGRLRPRDGGDLARGPIVHESNETSVLLEWTTAADEKGLEVRLGKRTLVPTAKGRDYELRIEGLQPRTPQEYAIVAGGRTLASGVVTTDGEPDFSFVVVGGGAPVLGWAPADNPVGGLLEEALRRKPSVALVASSPELVATTDPAFYERQLSLFQDVLAPTHRQVPVFQVFANPFAHSVTYAGGGGRVKADPAKDASAEAIYSRVVRHPANGPAREALGSPPYGETTYWVDRGSVRFFFLNSDYWLSSNPRALGGNLRGYYQPEQLDWLRREVRRADNDDAILHTFFFAQLPIFPVADAVDTGSWYRGGDTNGNGRPDEEDIAIVTNRNELWSILSDSKKTAAFISGGEAASARLLVTKDTPIGEKKNAAGKKVKFKNPAWQLLVGKPVTTTVKPDTTVPWHAEVKAFETEPRYFQFIVEGKRVTMDALDVRSRLVERVVIREAGKNAAPKEPRKK